MSKKHSNFKNDKRNRNVPFLVAILVTAVLAITTVSVSLNNVAKAAAPENGALSPAGPDVTWNGLGRLNANPQMSEAACREGVDCDTFRLTVSGTQADWAGKAVKIRINWTSPIFDYALSVHKGTNQDPVTAYSDNDVSEPRNFEEVTINPGETGVGEYSVRAVYFTTSPEDAYQGVASVTTAPVATPTPTPPAQSTEAAPRFVNYAAPNGFGSNAGEPTLGVNWETGKVLFIASLQTLRVSFDDSGSPARATWEDVSAPNTSAVTLDPLLFTDGDAGAPRTNRTFVSQLAGKISLMSFTDDDGKTWTPSQGAGINSGVDHQTIGGGPYAKNSDGTLKGGAVQRPGPNGKIYPNAVYYASQDIGMAQIARSDDGGFTFGPAIPMWDLTQANGLHGHIKVASDGTVYVPNKNCGGNQCVAVSEDNGLTWQLRKIPGSTAGRTDPSVGIGANGTVYFGYANGDGTPHAAVSRDRGKTWVDDQNVGFGQDIKNTVFSAVVGGDDNRAAYFFLGTTTPGAGGVQTDKAFPGVWYGYISTTYDGGKTWVTVNATPGDPVQRGVVCTSGTTCPDGTRNLLDFNDLTIDKQGRVLAALADGCVSAACIGGSDRSGPSGTPDGRIDGYDNDGTELATIVRQSGGKSLFAAFDPPANAAPAAPVLLASKDGDAVNLTWSTPEDNGSAITNYKLYRGVEGGAESLLGSFGADVHSYTDTAADGAYYYRITTSNANGTGASSPRVVPTTPQSPCTGSGITVVTDPKDDERTVDPVNPQHDIRSISIAEPYYADGSNKLVFTMQMSNLNGTLTPATTWRTTFTGADGNLYFVDMRTDALGAITYKYGTGTGTAVGNAEAGSGYDPATGAIKVIVLTNKFGNIQPGQMLKGIYMRVTAGAIVPDNANFPNPSQAVTYEVIGNAACQARPNAPASLTAAEGGKGIINLAWADRSDNEVNFLIERSTTLSGGFTQIATANADATAFTDRSAARKTTYYYRVRAINSVGGKSGYSNVANARTK